MEYRIDREALDEFIDRQVELIESVSVPRLLEDVVELRLRHESTGQGEVRALWLGAGLATHVGLAIFEERALRHRRPVTRCAGRGARSLSTEGGDMQTIDQPAHRLTEAERPLWFGQTPAGCGDAADDRPEPGGATRRDGRAAGLDWTVEQHRLEAVVAAERVPVPRQVANVRSDTRAVLGVVGEGTSRSRTGRRSPSATRSPTPGGRTGSAQARRAAALVCTR